MNRGGVVNHGNLKHDSTTTKFSTLTDASASRVADGTVYQNTTGAPIFVSVLVTTPGAGNYGLTAYCDSGAVPALAVSADSTATAGAAMCVTFVVPNNYYYKVTPSAAVNLTKWIEWSS